MRMDKKKSISPSSSTDQSLFVIMYTGIILNVNRKDKEYVVVTLK